MSRLRNIWKGNSKHQKFPDELSLAIDQDFYGDDFTSTTGSSTYKIKYLGHIPVDLSRNTEETATKAIESIISLSKVNKKIIQKVVVTVNLRGIEVTDIFNSQTLLDVSIFRIVSCLAYVKSKRVFAFLATDAQEATECHAFLCSKRSVAQGLAITVAQMFNTVQHMSQSEQSELNGSVHCNKSTNPSLIHFDGDMKKYLEKSSVPRLDMRKLDSVGINLKDTKFPFSKSSLAYAEVYPNPDAYKASSQRFDYEEWPENRGGLNQSAELIVF